MRKINLIFDGVYDDADILLVPECIAEDTEKVMYEFGKWLLCAEEAKRFRTLNAPQGKFYEIGTDEFIWWLNNIKITEGTKASIIKQHIEYDPLLPKAEL